MSSLSLTGDGQELWFGKTASFTRLVRVGLGVQYQSCAIVGVSGRSAQVACGLLKLFGNFT